MLAAPYLYSETMIGTGVSNIARPLALDSSAYFTKKTGGPPIIDHMKKQSWKVFFCSSPQPCLMPNLSMNDRGRGSGQTDHIEPIISHQPTKVFFKIRPLQNFDRRPHSEAVPGPFCRWCCYAILQLAVSLGRNYMVHCGTASKTHMQQHKDTVVKTIVGNKHMIAVCKSQLCALMASPSKIITFSLSY